MSQSNQTTSTKYGHKITSITSGSARPEESATGSKVENKSNTSPDSKPDQERSHSYREDFSPEQTNPAMATAYANQIANSDIKTTEVETDWDGAQVTIDVTTSSRLAKSNLKQALAGDEGLNIPLRVDISVDN